MAYWLASKRRGQTFDYIQRFDPRFWTVDFPRPMMASVVTSAADGLRVDLEYHHGDSLAGLIWDSVDRLDHPLLAYETNRDYSHTILRFRWRSAGIIPLDQVNGPTLTIQGRDAAGQPHSWYVRLWNYAVGTPEDASIELPFSQLLDGWDITAGTTSVHPADIDRMFISLAPPGFSTGAHVVLPQRVDAWVELSAISCDGEHGLLEIGDVLIPEHPVRMATAYDDSYNQTPERIVRSLRGLGYREDVVHYVGMSHYFRLVPDAAGHLLVDRSGEFAGPCSAWHASFLEHCARADYKVALSLSYELFDEHCPDDWKQRFFDGTPALTGWVPPSTLLSPSHGEAMDYLRAVAERFVRMAMHVGMEVAFQIGEPWWWQAPDRRVCLYDDASRAHFRARLGFDAPDLGRLTDFLSDNQKQLLDEAGHVLGNSVCSIRDRVRQVAGPSAEVMILLFTPTILDSATPEAYRANVPAEWAWPAFDRLQLEDYDWLTAGAEALRREAYVMMQERLQYPLSQQDYLSGFVLSAQDAVPFWKRIDNGIDEAFARGVDRCFLWALPQVARDGYTRLPDPGDGDTMEAFDDVLYPLALGRDAGVSPEFSTSVAVTASGHERRTSHWADARLRFDVGPGIRSEEELGLLISFFRARRGAARGFRLGDPFDFSSNKMTGVVGPLDQVIGRGDGLAGTFQLVKRYGSGTEPQVRQITRPRRDSVRMAVNGVETTDFSLQPGGKIILRVAPAAGAQVTAGFLFDVPVRFAEDRLDITGAAFAAGEAPSVPIIEIRETV
jgi:uncharacterized protein (TIGR02217 family)